jgi:hypothetical protein
MYRRPFLMIAAVAVCALIVLAQFPPNVSAQSQRNGSLGMGTKTILAQTNNDRFSQPCDPGPNRALNKNNCGIIAYIVVFINTLSAAVGIVVTIMIVWGGIQYSSSRDNPQQTQEAKTRIRNAIFALVFYLFIFSFLQWLVPGGVI